MNRLDAWLILYGTLAGWQLHPGRKPADRMSPEELAHLTDRYMEEADLRALGPMGGENGSSN